MDFKKFAAGCSWVKERENVMEVKQPRLPNPPSRPSEKPIVRKVFFQELKNNVKLSRKL